MRSSSIARVLMAALSLSFVLVLAGCEDKVTDANFNKITNGMMLSQVQTLFGSKGKDDTPPAGYEISGGGVMTSQAAKENIYSWKNKEFTYVITVKDGKVVDHRKVAN